jgi:HD-like signal output (HDOD) protein/ActR/RegA family two-component response regulator
MSATRRRILFVDDEQMILTGLRHGLRKQVARWDMVFAATGASALAELAAADFDVIVSDMRMPQMDGVTLLETVRRLHPLTARTILTGYAEPDAISSVFVVAHLVLEKPCSLPALVVAIERAGALHDVLSDPAACALAARCRELPPPPKLYFDIALSLEYPEIPIADITASLEADPQTCHRVLELCSPELGFERTYTSAADAVAELGAEVIGPLVLASHAWAAIGAIPNISLADTKRHGLAIARLAATSPDRAEASDAFATGLLHDLGKLLLARYWPAEYAAVVALTRETGCRVHVAETQLLGVTHATLAAHVLAWWGVALPIIDAVAHHHSAPTPGSLAGAISAAHLQVPRSEPVIHAHN